VEIKAVPYFGVLKDKIGYIRLKKFSEKSSQEVAQAISELVPQKISGLILDLRGNPGGLLSEAVEVSGLFLDGKKLIMETRGQDPYQNQQFYSERKALLPDLPLVVLVDGGSASAAEIVAGAIQDWDRGVIIGDTTFGKGMVQSILELEDGLALKLTTAKYFTPSGRCLQRANGESGQLLASVAGHPEVQPETLAPVEYFKTQAGRKVPGSGGIVPDILQPGIRISNLEYQLSREGIFFDFAVAFLSSPPDVGPEFETNEEVFRRFLDFVKSKDFHYESVSKQELENLVYLTDEEFKSPAVKQKLTDLDWYIQQEEKDIFSRQKPALQWRIKEAILINRFGEKARYENVWLLYHPEIFKAKEVLQDKNVYNSILAAGSD
jgi:carboxyl-terminal processing protease